MKNQTSSQKDKARARSMTVRKAAAQAAVVASKKTGRPVDPRVGKLASQS
ncbi:hypothetical protein [uncultured Gordonia sp.]|nr:hypothetical protein [uncultured Gordonia sp.]